MAKARPRRRVAAEALVQPELPTLPYEVREVSVKSALTRCTYPGLPWSLNPYQGCAHGCKFCYVPTLVHQERERWGRYVLVKRNAPALLAREVRHLPRDLVALSTATDPYQSVEARCFVTRHCLEVLAKAQWPVSVLTRSPLVLRDVDVFHRFDDFQVGMSLPTLDDGARRALEPGAPGVEARLRCLRRLADEGFQTFVSVAPLYPFTGGVTAEAFARALADAGVREAMVGGYRHYGDSWEHMVPAMRAGGVAGLERMADAAHMREVVRELGEALERHGVRSGGRAERLGARGTAAVAQEQIRR